jgi:hypothetical protein
MPVHLFFVPNHTQLCSERGDQVMSMDIVQSTLSEFAKRHWILGGIGASLPWFVAGEKSKHNIGPLSRGVGVVILLVVCGWTIAEQEWFGLIGGIVVLSVEVYWIMRARQRESASGSS